MANPCCPTCGRAFKAPKAAPVVDLAAMSTDQRIAYYRKTSPVEDVRFALRAQVNLSPALRDDWQALLNLAPTLTRSEAQRRLSILQARWRDERNRIALEKRFAWDVAQHVRRVYLPLRLDPARLVA